MPVRIVFLGPLRDLVETGIREAPAPLDWPGLLDFLGPQIAAAIEDDRVHVACAGKVLADKTALLAYDGDEIALLPPVSGG